jgi:hypothetical protein
MKRLLILAAVALFAFSAVGCECCRWCRRGAFLPTATPDPCAEPCPPAYSSGCDSCVTAPTMTPGPETYVPAN